MEFEIVRTADDGYLVYSSGSEATRYDKELRLRGPIEKSQYEELKQLLSNVKLIEADHRIDALNKFADSEKAFQKEVLSQTLVSQAKDE